MQIYYRKEMWRPLVDVRDATRVYIACLEADEEKVRRVRETLKEIEIDAEIKANYEYKGIRSYRISDKKIQRALDFKPLVSIKELVKNMVAKIKEYKYTDFDNPRYYNIRWMRLLEEAKRNQQFI